MPAVMPIAEKETAPFRAAVSVEMTRPGQSLAAGRRFVVPAC